MNITDNTTDNEPYRPFGKCVGNIGFKDIHCFEASALGAEDVRVNHLLSQSFNSNRLYCCWCSTHFKIPKAMSATSLKLLVKATFDVDVLKGKKDNFKINNNDTEEDDESDPFLDYLEAKIVEKVTRKINK